MLGEPLYLGTCRLLDIIERKDRIAAGEPHAWRLNMQEVARRVSRSLTWYDRDVGEVASDPMALGDVVLARKDIATSYHLAVTLDDAFQQVTLVTRGRDLFSATHVHRLLQELLNLPVPEYHHHDLVKSADGKSLSKRDGSCSLRTLRDQGWSQADVMREVGMR